MTSEVTTGGCSCKWLRFTLGCWPKTELDGDAAADVGCLLKKVDWITLPELKPVDAEAPKPGFVGFG